MTAPRRVDIVLSELHDRDATSTHARLQRDLLVDDGHIVRFVAERTTVADEHVTPLERWKADADLTILQHSIGSVAASEIARRRVPVVLNYHNVTPAEFVEPWEPDHIRGLQWGREQLWELRPVTRHAIADSDYNARELRELGYPAVSVAPVLFEVAGSAHGGADPSSSVGAGGVGSGRGGADSRGARGAAGSGSGFGGGPGGGGGSGAPSPAVTLLFVGRVAPNKCQQDLVGVLAGVVALGVDARLVLVGGVSSVGYRDAVVGLAQRLGVRDRVVLAGSVSEGELVGWYEGADVFVSVSEHEGFGVPLVEAMGFGVPVVAFGAAAVGETVGGAGLVVGEKSVGVVAEAVVRVVSDPVVREGLVVRGRVRAAELGLAGSVGAMRAVLAPLLAEAAP